MSMFVEAVDRYCKCEKEPSTSHKGLVKINKKREQPSLCVGSNSLCSNAIKINSSIYNKIIPSEMAPRREEKNPVSFSQQRSDVYKFTTPDRCSIGCQLDVWLCPVHSSACKRCPSPLCLSTPPLPHLASWRDRDLSLSAAVQTARQIKANRRSQ